MNQIAVQMMASRIVTTRALRWKTPRSSARRATTAAMKMIQCLAAMSAMPSMKCGYEKEEGQ